MSDDILTGTHLARREDIKDLREDIKKLRWDLQKHIDEKIDEKIKEHQTKCRDIKYRKKNPSKFIRILSIIATVSTSALVGVIFSAVFL